MCTLTELVISKYRVSLIKVIPFNMVKVLPILSKKDKSIGRGIANTFQAQKC